VAIYVTIDWDKMITTVDAWISPKHRDEVRALGREINETVAGFVRGQTVICLILGVFYATVLRSVGLPHSRSDQLCPVGQAQPSLADVRTIRIWSPVRIIGLLVAVPLAAAIGVLLRFAIRNSGTRTIKVATPP